MTDSRPRKYRRCRCHKALIIAEYGEGYAVVKRFCGITRKEIKLDQTYVATYDNHDEIQTEPKPEEQPVQKGCKME